MKIIIVGGCHVANYGLRDGKGFIQQWTKHLSIVRREPVQVSCFGLMTFHRLPTLVKQYYTTLQEADLILLQMGNYELSYRGAFWDLFFTAPPPNLLSERPASSDPFVHPTALTQFSNADVYTYPRHWFDWLKNSLKVLALTWYQHVGGRIGALERLAQSMTRTDEQLHPFASKTVMLMPFPSLNAVDHWLRGASKPLFRQEATRHGFTLLDVSPAVPLRRSYFLADTYHLNQRGHTKVAHCLIRNLQRRIHTGGPIPSARGVVMSPA